MANSGCPPFRKGSTKAALTIPAIDGELEPPRRTLAEFRPVEAEGARDLAAKLAVVAMRALEEDLHFGEARERQETARTLAAVAAKLMGDDNDKPPEMTPEERHARLMENFRNPDPELLKAMRESATEIREALAKEESR